MLVAMAFKPKAIAWSVNKATADKRMINIIDLVFIPYFMGHGSIVNLRFPRIAVQKPLSLQSSRDEWVQSSTESKSLAVTYRGF